MVEQADEREYTVLSALLELLAAGRRIPIRDDFRQYVVVRELSLKHLAWSPDRPLFTENWLQNQLPGADSDAVKSFLTNNRREGCVEAEPFSPLPVTLASESEIRDLFRDTKDCWERLYDRYPGCPGYLRLSRVGWNVAGDQALVYWGNWAGPAHGFGAVALMVQREREWAIDGEAQVWGA